MNREGEVMLTSGSERTYSPCTGGPPPTCCQPPLSERTARLERAQAAVDASWPKACPECRSDRVFWIFDPDARYFECEAGHRWEDAR